MTEYQTSFTPDDLHKLERAMTSGVRSVTFSDGRAVNYRSLEEMHKAWSLIAGRLGIDASKRRRFAEMRKGVMP